MSKENRIKDSTQSGAIKILWISGFFREERTLSGVISQIKKRWGHNFSSSSVSKALNRVSYLNRKGKKRLYKYIQKIDPSSKKTEFVSEQLFSGEILEKLEKDFGKEIQDLRLNFGQSGTCSAFLLRKILEKLIYKVFAKQEIIDKLDDESSSGRLVGLEKMINLASAEKNEGMPLITMSTAKKIKGIKFLGDSSAHNPLVNVDMQTIIPQMPYIMMAYKELAYHL